VGHIYSRLLPSCSLSSASIVLALLIPVGSESKYGGTISKQLRMTGCVYNTMGNEFVDPPPNKYFIEDSRFGDLPKKTPKKK
jgi:hypothetical protein